MAVQNFLPYISIVKFLLVIFFFVQCVNLGQSFPAEDSNVPIVGGSHPRDVKDETILKITKAAITKVDSLKGETCQREIRDVIEAKSQVVAGTRYDLKVEMCTPEMCNGIKQVPLCSICTLDVWEKSWENFFQVTKMTCPTQEKWNYSHKE